MRRIQESPRVALIGCGAISQRFHLPALSKSRQVSGLTLVDTNAASLAAAKTQISAEFESRTVQTLGDYRRLEGVDAVVIATPPASHFEIARWCLERGLHVLCEKPLVETAAEAEALCALAAKTETLLAVNQTRRLFPTYQAIRHCIEDGTLGELQSIVYHDGIEFDWPAASPHHFQRHARGAWADTGVHLLDTICYWLGERPALEESFHDGHGGPEAMATVRLRLRQCAIELKVSRLGRLSNSFAIRGALGIIEAQAEDWSSFEIRFQSGKVRRCTAAPRGRFLQYTDFAAPLIDNFVAAVAGRAELLVPADSTLDTIRLLERAYERAAPYAMPWNRHWEEAPHGI